MEVMSDEQRVGTEQPSNARDPWSQLDAEALVRDTAISRWTGPAWRFHKRIYAADDPTGSLHTPGRFHWDQPTLYLALRSQSAQGEVSRHLNHDTVSLLRNSYRLTELWIELDIVLITCRQPACLESVMPGVTFDDLCADDNFTDDAHTLTRRLGSASCDRGVEGLLVPSCTGYEGGNLVLFPSNLRACSVIRIVRSEDPTLFVER